MELNLPCGNKPLHVTECKGECDLGEKTITENGEYNASEDSLNGYSKVTVNVELPSANGESF